MDTRRRVGEWVKKGRESVPCWLWPLSGVSEPKLMVLKEYSMLPDLCCCSCVSCEPDTGRAISQC